MQSVVLHFRASSPSSAFKFIVFDQLKNLVGIHPIQQNQIDFLANAVDDVECSDIDFSTHLDKSIVDVFEEECEAILRHSVTIPRKSFVCLFKVSRLSMTLIYETIRASTEMALEMSNTGFICLFSSFQEYSYISLGVSAYLSPTSRRELFENMSHLARLSSFELHLLAKYENARQTASSESSLAKFISSNIHDKVTSTAMETETGDHSDGFVPSKRHRGLGYDDLRNEDATRESEVSNRKVASWKRNMSMHLAFI